MEFYRYYTDVWEEGLVLRCMKYVSLHESPAYYWCVPERREDTGRSMLERGHGITHVMRRCRGRKIHRDKHSKIAQPTHESALESLLMRKRHHVVHARRSMQMAQKIIDAFEGEDVDKWPDADVPGVKHIPGTDEFVRDNYDFDY